MDMSMAIPRFVHQALDGVRDLHWRPALVGEQIHSMGCMVPK
jgi:hypothetical protein